MELVKFWAERDTTGRAIECVEASVAEELEILAQRYLWLRENKSKNSDAPFVMNRAASVLYGIAKYKGEELDAAIDADIVGEKAQELYISGHIEENELMEVPEGGSWKNAFLNEEYVDLLYYEAQRILNISDERMIAASIAGRWDKLFVPKGK